MSQVRLDRIGQHDIVLPYILNELKNNIQAITPVLAIYLFGSRSRIAPKNWNTLNGKDWDIFVVCAFPIVNTQIWTTDLNYNIDLHVVSEQQAAHFLKYNSTAIMLYPENKLET